MVDIRNQFSLDWLGGGGPSEKTAGLDEATLHTYSRPLLANLRDDPRHEMRLYELAKQSSGEIPQFNFKNCLTAVNHLANLGLVRILEEDPAGNYLIRLIK